MSSQEFKALIVKKLGLDPKDFDVCVNAACSSVHYVTIPSNNDPRGYREILGYRETSKNFFVPTSVQRQAK